VGGHAGGVDHDRHPRVGRGLAAADREALDVEGPPPEQARDAVQHAGLVLNAGHQGVLHACTSSPAGRRTMASRFAPAGTMGYTLSSFSTRKSTSAARPDPRTVSTVGPTSSRRLTRWPAMP